MPHVRRSIVGFIGAGVGLEHGDPNRSFMVQELLEGGTFKSLLQRQMLQNPTPLYSEAAGLDMCLQIANGLRHLHMAHPLVIHRDLKLENLMLACEYTGLPRQLTPAPLLAPRPAASSNPAAEISLHAPPWRTPPTPPRSPPPANKPGPDGLFTAKIADFGLSRTIAARRQRVLQDRLIGGGNEGCWDGDGDGKNQGAGAGKIWWVAGSPRDLCAP
jgi:serine/threonine protein kinase